MAAKRMTEKRRKTAKKRAPTGSAAGQGASEASLRKYVRDLQKNHEKYEKLHKALMDAKTDPKRKSLLDQFATNNRKLMALLPAESEKGYCITNTLYSLITCTD